MKNSQGYKTITEYQKNSAEIITTNINIPNIYNRIIIPILLISYITAKEKITEIQKIKGRVCLSLQSRKYQEEKEPMTNWIEHLSKEFNIEPKQVLFMCLSMCYKLISDKLARKI